MKDPRYSLWQVLALLGAGLVIMFGCLSCGLAVGFFWGRDHGVAALARELLSNRTPVQTPTLPWQQLPSEPVLPPEVLPVLGQPHLGVTFENVTPQMARQENLDVRQGAIIREVIPGSPADEADLRVGDVITAVDARPVDEDHTLRERIMSYSPGDKIELTVVRNDVKMSIMVTLGEATPIEP